MCKLVNESTLGGLAQAFKTLLLEFANLIPYVLLAVVVLVASAFLIKLVNKVIRWVSKTLRLDEFVRELVPGGLRLSVTSLVILLTDVGIALITLLIVVRIFYLIVPSTASEIIPYVSKLGSVTVMLILFVVALDLLSKVIVFERKTESLFFIVLFFLGLAMIIDLTGLSADVKAALGWGLAIGVGLALGIFVAWFLFSEYLDRLVKEKERTSEKSP